jgi:hypothetical protein
MRSAVVISQPMFLPWLGLFEQIRLADVFVHYDDVQLPQGRSFISRVQVKSDSGVHWLSAPVNGSRSGAAINESWLVSGDHWRRKHIATLRQSYARAPFVDEMISLAERIYSTDEGNLARFNQLAIEQIADWLGIRTPFYTSSALGISGRSSERLISICRHFGATQYLTGLGALRYLDHESFETHGIEVRYMDYRKQPYPQPHGEFTPFVTVLDAIACCGRGVRELMVSGTLNWREHVDRSR